VNAFYLTIRKDVRSVPELVLSMFACIDNSEISEKESLHIFDDSRSKVVQNKGYTLFNIGTLIYKHRWRRKALELIIEQLSSGKSIEDIMLDTKGQFCLVVHSADDLFIITDKLGSFPVYYFEDEDTIQITNILLLLAKKNNVSINHQAFAEYISFDYCLNSTLFNEIEPLNMGTIYQFGRERRVYTYDEVFDDIQFNKYADLAEVANEARETLVNNLSFLTSDDRIFVDLTGGFDTRTMATILNSMGTAFDCGICGEQVHKESKIAARVAQILGVKLLEDIKITDRRLFRVILDQHFTITTGVPMLYHSSELINYYQYIEREYDIHLTGFGGTELTIRTLPKLNLFSSKINKNSLFQKYRYWYPDIFINEFITEGMYRTHLTEKIDRLLQTIGSEFHAETANFLRLSTFTKCYAGCLIGTHNIILPFYSPFLEANYVRLMLQTSYDLKEYHNIQRAILTELNPMVSSIVTPHGYSAHTGSKRDIPAFRKCRDSVKNLARQIIYQFSLCGAMKWSQNVAAKIRPRDAIAEVQRAFWVNEVDEAWSSDLEIFVILDRNKFKKHLARESYATKLKAKMLFLNRVITECNPKLR